VSPRTSCSSAPPTSTDCSIRDLAAVSPAAGSRLLSDNTGHARERHEQAEIGERQTLSAARCTSSRGHAEGSAAVVFISPGSRGSLVQTRGSTGADRAADNGHAACAFADANSSTAGDEPRSFATIANRCSAVDHVAARGGKPPHSRGRDPSQITFGACDACASGTRRPGTAVKTVRTRHPAEHGRFTERRGVINEPRRGPATTRRRNRTFQAGGCPALPVLKTGWATRPLPRRW
jgi:hypothetical protein